MVKKKIKKITFLLGKGFQTALTLTSVPLERSPCFHAWLQLPRCLLQLQDRCSVSPLWSSTSLFCLWGLTICYLFLNEVSQPFLEFLQPLFNALSLACLSWWPAIKHCSLWASLPLSLLSWSKEQEKCTSSLEALPHHVLWKQVKAQNKYSEQ